MTDETPPVRKANANLKPYQPGQSGNPKGRPKGALSRSTLARKYLDARLPGKKDPFGVSTEDLTIADMIMLALINKAQKGDINAIRELMDSGYGKNPDIIAGDADNPLETSVTVKFVSGEKLPNDKT